MASGEIGEIALVVAEDEDALGAGLDTEKWGAQHSATYTARRSSRNSDAGATLVDEQVIACSRACDVEQVAFGVIDLLQLRVVAYRFDSLL